MNPFKRLFRSPSQSAFARQVRPQVETLEDRTVPAVYRVLTLGDETGQAPTGGTGTANDPFLIVSLRSAVEQANTIVGEDEITFDPTVFGTFQTITLGGTALPDITDDLLITGPRSGVAVSANENSNVLVVDAAAEVELVRMTIRDGVAIMDGAGITNAGTLTLREVHVTRNTANGTGTAGIANTGTLFVLHSTVSLNDGEDGDAGGINNDGTATIINSTISANIGETGGGIVAVSGTLMVRNSTISGNETDGDVGGGIRLLAGTTTLHNTIVAGNFQGSGFNDNPSDLEGAVNVAAGSSFNLIGDSGSSGGLTDGTDDNIVGNAGAGTIATETILVTTATFNGGRTPTHVLVAGSLAINNGNAALSLDELGNALTNDQRGNPFVRQSGGAVDIGAFERQTLANLSLVVDSEVDDSDGRFGAGRLSLREAVELANGSAGDNTITFAGSLNGTAHLLNLGQITIAETVTIRGNGSVNTIIDAQELSRIFNIVSGVGDVSLEKLAIRNGRTAPTGNPQGGAVFSNSTNTLFIRNSVFEDNSTTRGGGQGGAIRTEGGDVVVIRSTFTGNSTSAGGGQGGAIRTESGDVEVIRSTFTGNSTSADGAQGGAIRSESGNVTISNSTFVENSTEGDGAEGGAVRTESGEITIVNSTFTANSTSGVDAAGAAIRSETGAITIINSTIVNNTAAQGPGGGISAADAAVTIHNSIVALNTDDGTAPDLFAGGMLTVMNSLIGDNTGTGLTEAPVGSPDGNGNLIGDPGGAGTIDPLLQPLAFNGGPTQTFALQPNSPALDAGSNALALDADGNPLASDQRGDPFVRRSGARVDMGSFEAQPDPQKPMQQLNGFSAKVWQALLGEQIDRADFNRFQSLLRIANKREARQRVVRQILATRDYALLGIRQAFQRLLNRNPGAQETEKWLGVVQAQRSVTFLQQINPEMLRGLLNSQEYFAQSGGTLEGFVQNALNDLFGGVTPPGFSAEGKTKLQIIDDLLSRPRLAVIELHAAFRAFFGKAPSTALVAEWTQRLEAGDSARFILVEALAS
jgi:hypothetical protein